MANIYTPGPPWAGPYPQEVTDNNGNTWFAYGPRSIKKEPIAQLAPADDCCLYFENSTEILVDGTPPATPTFAPAEKSDDDTLIQTHPNGQSGWTCVGGVWVLDWVRPDAEVDDCCLYFENSTEILVDGTPPTTPTFAPAEKSDDDTLIQTHPNGQSGWTCAGGVWVLDWVRPDAEADDCCLYFEDSAEILVDGTPPATPTFAPTGKSEGDTLIQTHTNGQSGWTCVGGVWLLDWVRLDAEADDCCLYFENSTEILVDGTQPATPTFAPAEKSDGDTLIQTHPNGQSGWTCAGGVWVFEWVDIRSPSLSLLDCNDVPIQTGGQVLTPANVPSDADYAAANAGDCSPEDGMPIGKTASGQLRQQPPMRCATENASLSQVTVAGAAITALATGAPVILFSDLCVTLVNESCYEMMGRAFFRTNFQINQGPNGYNYWIVQTQNSATGAATWTGDSVMRRTTCASSDCVDRASFPIMELGTIPEMQPGEVSELCQSVTFQAIQYAEHPASVVGVGANTVSAFAVPCQGEFLPTTETTGTVEV